MMKYQFTVIMPALNEAPSIAAAIRDVVQSYERLSIFGEIIVVNDGSTDKTAAVVEDLMKQYPFIRIIHHTKPLGIGKSYWEAVQIAEGELITWMPGDAETASYEVLRYVPLFQHVDVVIPFIFNPNVRNFQRRFLSKLYKAILNFSFGTLLNYMNGATIYRKCVLQEIHVQTTGFFFQVELLMKAMRLGYLYAEVPSALAKRLSGKSKAFTFRSFIHICRDYLLTAVSIYLTYKKPNAFHPDSATHKRWAEVENLKGPALTDTWPREAAG